jgi:hypothetical protein
MKTKYQAKFFNLVLILTVLNFSTAKAQTSSKETYRNLIKETLNGYYLDDNEKSFNAFSDTDNLNLDLDYKIDLTMSEIREINEPNL